MIQKRIKTKTFDKYKIKYLSNVPYYLRYPKLKELPFGLRPLGKDSFTNNFFAGCR